MQFRLFRLSEFLYVCERKSRKREKRIEETGSKSGITSFGLLSSDNLEIAVVLQCTMVLQYIR